jgi:HAD superfamily hydrolase (TIGR01509 family)
VLTFILILVVASYNFYKSFKVVLFSGLRKPDKRVYLEATRQLKVDPSHCIFIDDRSKNVEAAVEVGMVGIVFQDAKQVERELAGFGYVF